MNSDQMPPKAISKTRQVQRLIQSMDPKDFCEFVGVILEAAHDTKGIGHRGAVELAVLLANFARAETTP